jgi:death-on-curing protein
MNAPIFLTLDEVLRTHADMVQRYGGSEGVRDLGLLESALAQPGAGFGGEYFYKDFASMAAAYLFHIVKNHPFVDGIKRTGVAAAIVFLKMNGISIRADQEAIEELASSLAAGAATKDDAVKSFNDRIEQSE